MYIHIILSYIVKKSCMITNNNNNNKEGVISQIKINFFFEKDKYFFLWDQIKELLLLCSIGKLLAVAKKIGISSSFFLYRTNHQREKIDGTKWSSLSTSRYYPLSTKYLNITPHYLLEDWKFWDSRQLSWAEMQQNLLRNDNVHELSLSESQPPFIGSPIWPVCHA